jgi:hypothetical protein
LTCLPAGLAWAGNVIPNGDFETGLLTPWTAFSTSAGTFGGGPYPDVVSFDTSGTGASLAAQLNVGFTTSDITPQGGGIEQDLIISTSGTYTFFANIASQDDASGAINADGGTFSILIDGNSLATNSIGAFGTAHQIVTGTLSGSVSLNSGPHTFQVLITRDGTTFGANSPTEYLDNLALNSPDSSTPEPASWGLVALALAGFAVRIGRNRTPAEPK